MAFGHMGMRRAQEEADTREGRRSDRPHHRVLVAGASLLNKLKLDGRFCCIPQCVQRMGLGLLGPVLACRLGPAWSGGILTSLNLD